MKLSITIAGDNALPSAFVVFRGFEKCIPKAGKLGFDGVELALKTPDEINPRQLQQIIDDHQMEISCISTGQVYADTGLMLTHEDRKIRERAKNIFIEFIDLAESFGGIVNIGRVRGQVGERPRQHVETLFVEVARELCSYALTKGVTLILEPVNRYEIDFINTVDEGVALMRKVNMPNMLLMPDLFHMNIEDKTISEELAKNIQFIKYIHVADSNRQAPGYGHLNFRDIFNHLFRAGYDGWLSAEILPLPDSDTAAKQAANFLLPFIKEYNEKKKTIAVPVSKATNI